MLIAKIIRRCAPSPSSKLRLCCGIDTCYLFGWFITLKDYILRTFYCYQLKEGLNCAMDQNIKTSETKAEIINVKFDWLDQAWPRWWLDFLFCFGEVPTWTCEMLKSSTQPLYQLTFCLGSFQCKGMPPSKRIFHKQCKNFQIYKSFSTSTLSPFIFLSSSALLGLAVKQILNLESWYPLIIRLTVYKTTTGQRERFLSMPEVALT